VDLLNSDQYYDMHAIAGLLKLYLRELPTNVLTRELHMQFLNVLEVEDRPTRVASLHNLVQMLPAPNYALLKVLSKHLIRIVDNQEVNKMSIRNVGIVFSPTLNIPAGVFSLFLSEYSKIFGESVVVRTDDQDYHDGEEEYHPPNYEYTQQTPPQGGGYEEYQASPQQYSNFDPVYAYAEQQPAYQQQDVSSSSRHRESAMVGGAGVSGSSHYDGSWNRGVVMEESLYE